MANLAVFDFDRTLIDDDSDATIIRRLREKEPPPEWDSSAHDWTPYMSDIFEHAFTAGLTQGDILDTIASMRPTPGAVELLQALAAAGWDVLLLTDANTVFVKHWLKAHQLERAVTAVITNRAFFNDGRLYIEPCMRQTACPRCPANLCKSLALAEWRAARPQQPQQSPQPSRVVYSGDGRNDYCPATHLPRTSIVFPRRGYPLDKLIQETLASPSPQVVAQVVPWDNCYQILETLLPAQIKQ